MAVKTITKTKLGKWVTKILRKTRSKSGRALALLSIKELESRGEAPTLSNIVEEARKIIEQTEGLVNWGLTKSEYTVSLASAALRDLIEAGMVEEYSGVYRLKKKTSSDTVPAGIETITNTPYEIILMRR
ncbi:MAG: hypothetical protein F7C07_04995 [Desulfurococcales archaeon]|nr:hypothetical protein [Desulfurococcales archaeon]